MVKILYLLDKVAKFSNEKRQLEGYAYNADFWKCYIYHYMNRFNMLKPVLNVKKLKPSVREREFLGLPLSNLTQLMCLQKQKLTVYTRNLGERPKSTQSCLLDQSL